MIAGNQKKKDIVKSPQKIFPVAPVGQVWETIFFLILASTQEYS
jgi:hypothetical protein